MACTGCNEPTNAAAPQHAVRFKAWYTEGRVFEGCCKKWDALPEDGVLAVRVWFSDETSRVCSGDDWYAIVHFPDGFWTVIHNRESLSQNQTRYPEASWKAGRWTSEAEMQAVNAALMA